MGTSKRPPKIPLFRGFWAVLGRFWGGFGGLAPEITLFEGDLRSFRGIPPSWTDFPRLPGHGLVTIPSILRIRRSQDAHRSLGRATPDRALPVYVSAGGRPSGHVYVLIGRWADSHSGHSKVSAVVVGMPTVADCHEKTHPAPCTIWNIAQRVPVGGPHQYYDRYSLHFLIYYYI